MATTLIYMISILSSCIIYIINLENIIQYNLCLRCSNFIMTISLILIVSLTFNIIDIILIKKIISYTIYASDIKKSHNSRYDIYIYISYHNYLLITIILFIIIYIYDTISYILSSFSSSLSLPSSLIITIYLYLH